MKKFIIFLAVICFSNVSPAQNRSASGKFVLSGTMEGQNKGWLVLVYTRKDGQVKFDTTVVVKGRYSFEGYIKEPTFAALIGHTKSNQVNDPNFTDFFLEPDSMYITLSPDHFKEAKITGSFTQDEKDNLERGAVYKQRAILTTYYNQTSDSLEKYPGNKIFQQKLGSIREALEPIDRQIKAIEIGFIAGHPHSFFSSDRLRYYSANIPADSLNTLYNSLDSAVQNSFTGKLIAEMLNGEPGHLAYPFSTTDINGKDISLSSYKGKNYVLLDFWASWCVPCRKGNPHLIEIYNSYHPKGLEIIGIANDDHAVEKWKKAVAEDGIGGWPQVLQQYQGKNDLGRLFGVVPIPVKILVDKDGMIIGRYDNDEQLDNKLKEIFNTQ